MTMRAGVLAATHILCFLLPHTHYYIWNETPHLLFLFLCLLHLLLLLHCCLHPMTPSVRLTGAIVLTWVLLLVPGATHAAPRAELPHIVHVLADDLGWAGVSYHRANTSGVDVRTPHVDALLAEGVELDRFYTYKICSPSRCAIQTGRNPIHVNVVNVPPEVYNPNDRVAGYQGAPTAMTFMAKKLKQQQYATHFVGKYDVGMATELHHPKNRGFDSFYGYFHHSNAYWQQTVERCGKTPVRDLWRYNATFDGPALADAPAFGTCSQTNQTGCIYEESLFTREVLRIIRGHATGSSRPLYLFWAMHLVHMPLEVPSEYVARFSFIKEEHRRLNHAMISYMDDEVGKAVALLHEVGMWDNTLFIFHSDNGGEIMGAGLCGGNNWPLRGGKFSNFEGGIRVNALVAGGFIPEDRRGAKLDGLITSWDWYATIVQGIAGTDIHDAPAVAAGLPDVDSVNVWPYIAGLDESSPRQQIIIGDTLAPYPNSDGAARVGGIIRGRYKLLVGAPSRGHLILQNVLTGPKWPNASERLVPLLHAKYCGANVADGCLFDILSDPTESTNLAKSHPAIVQDLLDRMARAENTTFSPDRGKRDPNACKIAMGTYGGYWGPWLKNGKFDFDPLPRRRRF